MTKHQWVCDNCGNWVDFRQPELPHENYGSEQNEDCKICPECGEDMYFDEVFVPPVTSLVAPDKEDAS